MPAYLPILLGDAIACRIFIFSYDCLFLKSRFICRYIRGLNSTKNDKMLKTQFIMYTVKIVITLLILKIALLRFLLSKPVIHFIIRVFLLCDFRIRAYLKCNIIINKINLRQVPSIINFMIAYY